MNRKTINRGFSLIELSIVLVVVGLILGGLISSTTTFIENARASRAKAELEQIREAIIGYAITNGRLPCPSDENCTAGVYNPDGTEDCTKTWGFVPYRDLGLSARDPWNNFYVYRIGDGLNGVPIAVGTHGNIQIRDSAVGGTSIAQAVAAAIYSIGPNRGNGLAAGGGAPSSDEEENFNLNCGVAGNAEDNVLVYKNFVPRGAAQDEFDDIVIWISEYLLKARLSQAGVL